MTLTREDVILAYRLILGREPESEDAVAQMMAIDSLADLRRLFMSSTEFEHSRPLAVGRFITEGQADRSIECTDEQRAAMFARIAAEWQALGATEPHWSVLINEDFRQANLATHIERFYATGRRGIDVQLNLLRRAGIPTRFGRALDFGCGVGRLSFGLAPLAQEVVGVDISPPHLRLAEERAASKGIANTRFEAIAAVDDLDRYRGFDFVISLIVLQHNPPPIMAAIYAKLLAALAPGGVAVVQMPTFILGQAFSPADYLASEKPQMEMHALAQSIVYRLVEEADCRMIEVREDIAGGHFPGLSHTFCVQRR